MPSIKVMHMLPMIGAYGVERRLLNYLKLSKSQNTKDNIIHHVCALRISDALADELNNLDVPYIVNNIRGLKNINKFIEYVRENEIKILHVHNLLGHNLRTRIIPKIAGIPIIIEHEAGMIWDLNFTLTVKMTNCLVNINICNSTASQILLKEKCNINAEVIHNGVQFIAQKNDTDRLSVLNEQNINQKDFLVGFVGRLDTPKGVHAFIDMVPKILGVIPQTKFLVVGDGPMHQELLAYADRYPECKNSFKWLGFRKDVRRIMAALDVLVIPSIREPLSNVLLEASITGIPVVASNVDGIPEIIKNGQTGILIKCTNPLIKPISTKAKKIPHIVVDGEKHCLKKPLLPDSDAMAKAVVNLLKNPEKAKVLGDNAAESVRRKFSFDRYIDNVNKVYSRCISNMLPKTK